MWFTLTSDILKQWNRLGVFPKSAILRNINFSFAHVNTNVAHFEVYDCFEIKFSTCVRQVLPTQQIFKLNLFSEKCFLLNFWYEK